MARYTKLDLTIVILSAIFIAILLLSGYYEREIWILHISQSLIYITVIVLCLKHNKWGYGIGISIAALWNCYNIFFSAFFRLGIQEWADFLSTGRIIHKVWFLAPLAGLDHLAMIVCLTWAYSRLPDKKLSDLTILLGSFVGVTAYFVGIIVIFWPEFLRH